VQIMLVRRPDLECMDLLDNTVVACESHRLSLAIDVLPLGFIKDSVKAKSFKPPRRSQDQ